MIGALFIINTVVALVIGFTMSMLKNHFSRIEKSMEIYDNPKIYKTKSDTEFIGELIERYKKLDQVAKKTIDIDTMIEASFYKQKIGKFSYLAVQNVATKGTVIIWIILATQIGLEVLSPIPGSSITNFICIVSNTLICLLLTLAHVFKGINDQKSHLFVKIRDYILNIYPASIAEKDHQKDMKALLDRIQKLETELENYQGESAAGQDDDANSLHEEDIKVFLEKLNNES